MAMRAAEKIIEGLTQFMEGYLELQRSIEEEYGAEADDEVGDERSTSEVAIEIDAAIVTELRASIDAVMDAEDYSAEEFANAATGLTDAIEEIDPDVFSGEEEEDEAEDDDEDDSYDDDEYEEESLEELEDDEYDDDEDDEEY